MLNLPLKPATRKALLEERDATIKHLKKRIKELEAMDADAFLRQGLDVGTLHTSELVHALTRQEWRSIRADEPNNHWYISAHNYERRVTGELVADALNIIPTRR